VAAAALLGEEEDEEGRRKKRGGDGKGGEEGEEREEAAVVEQEEEEDEEEEAAAEKRRMRRSSKLTLPVPHVAPVRTPRDRCDLCVNTCDVYCGTSKYVVYVEVCPIPEEYGSGVHCTVQVCPNVGLQ